ncbi:MAG: VacJ family lipoprotein [Sedimentisphaerales bacterium]|nr:VacJ family lipoprotein [Sedimentisphaerales bacterium]
MKARISPRISRILMLSLAMLAVSGCNAGLRSYQQHSVLITASEEGLDLLEQEYQASGQMVDDPLEGFNRAVFGFNDAVMHEIIRPVSELYCGLVPSVVRNGISHFYHNATTPARFVSCMLQGRFDEAGMEFGRFVVNSTAGILGVSDFAGQHLGLVIEEDEDMGQALAHLGIGRGPYLVIPLLGPSSVRDAAGDLLDWLMNPLRYIEPWELYAGITTVRTVNDFPSRYQAYQQVTRSALEPYVALRQAYIQHRKASLDR